MIKINDIHYCAGLLEGEGCFRFNNGSPMIDINMTDYEPISKLRSIMLPISTVRTHHNRSLVTPSPKSVYHLGVCGQLAIEWMMILYTLMSPRRKEKIRECIRLWLSRGVNNQAHTLSKSNRKRYMRMI